MIEIGGRGGNIAIHRDIKPANNLLGEENAMVSFENYSIVIFILQILRNILFFFTVG